MEKREWLGEYDKWSDFILSFAREVADKVESNNLFSRSEIMNFIHIFEDSAELLEEVSTPFMTHTDLWQGNVLLEESEGRYKVAAIIDLDRTVFGDKYSWMINSDFLRGYSGVIPRTEHHNIRCNLYKLLSGFFDSYVSLVQYDDKEWFERQKANTVTLLNSFDHGSLNCGGRLQV